MKRDSFTCWVFGNRYDWISVRANSSRDARGLAAFRFHVPRHLIHVWRELETPSCSSMIYESEEIPMYWDR